MELTSPFCLSFYLYSKVNGIQNKDYIQQQVGKYYVISLDNYCCILWWRLHAVSYFLMVTCFEILSRHLYNPNRCFSMSTFENS